MDPLTLLDKPLPVRNLILHIPKTLLATLLTYHARAYQPRGSAVTSITPQSITITYLQPPRDLRHTPIPCTVVIPFTPALPDIPHASSSKQAQYEWECACANRLKEMETVAVERIASRGDAVVVVDRYLPPRTMASFLSIAWFVVLSALMAVWALRGERAPLVGWWLNEVFGRGHARWKFEVAAVVHAGIVVKKAGDVRKMAVMLKRHGVHRKRGVWLCWLVDVALEGWRCARRFEGEVARVGRGMAVEAVMRRERKKGK